MSQTPNEPTPGQEDPIEVPETPSAPAEIRDPFQPDDPFRPAEGAPWPASSAQLPAEQAPPLSDADRSVPAFEAPTFAAPTFAAPTFPSSGSQVPPVPVPPQFPATGPYPGQQPPNSGVPASGAPAYAAPAYAAPAYAPPGAVPPGYGAPGPVPVGFGPQPKGLAITALAVGITALVLCWVPFLGVLLGLVALGFGITALVKKQPFGFSLTGTILGGIATLIALLVTLIFSAILGGISRYESGSYAEEDTWSSSEIEAGPGSYEEPLAVGVPAPGDAWSVAITSVTEVTDAAVAYDEANDPPAEGFVYVQVDISGLYSGVGTGYSQDIGVVYLTEDGEMLFDDETGLTVLPETFERQEVPSGESVRGSFLFEVPEDDHGMLYVAPGDFDLFFYVQVP